MFSLNLYKPFVWKLNRDIGQEPADIGQEPADIGI